MSTNPLCPVDASQTISSFPFSNFECKCVCVAAVWCIALRVGSRTNLTLGGWKQDKLSRGKREVVVAVQSCSVRRCNCVLKLSSKLR